MLDDTMLSETDARLAAKAARQRIEAIDASAALHWIARVRNGKDTIQLTFDTAPRYGEIIREVHALNLMDEVDTPSVKVDRIKSRPFLLTA